MVLLGPSRLSVMSDGEPRSKPRRDRNVKASTIPLHVQTEVKVQNKKPQRREMMGWGWRGKRGRAAGKGAGGRVGERKREREGGDLNFCVRSTPLCMCVGVGGGGEREQV